MKYYLLAVTVLMSGCAAKPPKLCYELTLTFEERMSKQVICTTRPQTESEMMRKLK